MQCNNSDMAYFSKRDTTLFEIISLFWPGTDIPHPPTPPLIGPHYVQLKHHIINIDSMIIC